MVVETPKQGNKENMIFFEKQAMRKKLTFEKRKKFAETAHQPKKMQNKCINRQFANLSHFLQEISYFFLFCDKIGQKNHFTTN